MATLYKVLYGKSKSKKKKVLMIDDLSKCENYVAARKSQRATGHFDIVKAEEGEVRKTRKKIKGGYISGGMFNAHT